MRVHVRTKKRIVILSAHKKKQMITQAVFIRGGRIMNKILQKMRFLAMVIADDISIVTSLCFRRGNDPEISGLEI